MKPRNQHRKVRFCVRATPANEPIKATAPPVKPVVIIPINPRHAVLKAKRDLQRLVLLRECARLVDAINAIALVIIEPLVETKLVITQPYIEILHRRDEIVEMHERFVRIEREQAAIREHYRVSRQRKRFLRNDMQETLLLPKRPDFYSQRRIRQPQQHIRFDTAAE